jgi:hypothetical protein
VIIHKAINSPQRRKERKVFRADPEIDCVKYSNNPFMQK